MNKQVSRTYKTKQLLCAEYAMDGTRAVSISNVLRLPIDETRKACLLLRNKSSQSGQTPTDPNWFLANTERQRRGALLLHFYASFRRAMHDDGKVIEVHATALLLAYRLYTSIFQDSNPLISIERFIMLLGGFSLDWRNIAPGQVSHFTSENIKLMSCKTCNLLHLTPTYLLSFHCNECDN